MYQLTCNYYLTILPSSILLRLHFVQALKAKAITEGKIHGPRAKQQQFEQEGPVEYEPFDFPDGETWTNNAVWQECIATC